MMNIDINAIKITKKSLAGVLTALLAILLLSTCGKKEQFNDLHDYIDQLKQTEAHKHKINETPKLQPPESVKYTADALRSPFVESATVANRNTLANSPLQSYSLNVLKFVGTIMQKNGISAYILTPDKMIYRVEKGDLIGDHSGKIIDILENRISVIEPGAEPGKNSVQRMVTLQLKDEH